MFLDAHCHLLDYPDPGQITQIIIEAQALKIKGIFCNTTSVKQWKLLENIADHHDIVVPFVGVHPWKVGAGHFSQLEMAECLQKSFIGVGEIGLDKTCGSDFKVQEFVFISQLEIAIAHNRPFIIHCVKSWRPLLKILKTYNNRNMVFMVHGFNGSVAIMEELVDLGGYISFSCRLADNNRHKIREVLRSTPVDRLFLETDSPHQASADLAALNGLALSSANRVIVNTPSQVVYLYSFVAHLLAMDLDLLTKTIWNNGQIFTNQKTVGP